MADTWGWWSTWFSTDALVPTAELDRRRVHRTAAQVRVAAIVVFGGFLLWTLRGEPRWAIGAVVAAVVMATTITWITYRRLGVLPPHLALRDLVVLGLVGVVSPELLVPAMMTSLAVLAFAALTTRRRTTLVLAAVSVLAAVFFPLAVAAVTIPGMHITRAHQRSHVINDRIAQALGLCLWETTERAGRPTTATYLHGDTERLLGAESSVIMGNAGWETLLHPDDRAVGAQIDEAVRAGRDYRVRYRQRHSDGSFRWIEEVGHLVHDETGTVTNVLGMTHDVSQLVETDEQLHRFDSLVDGLDLMVSVFHLPDPADPTSLTLVYENRAARRRELQIERIGHRLVEWNSAAFDTERHRGVGYQLAAVADGHPPLTVPDVHLRIAGQIRRFSMVMSPLPDRHVAVTLHDVEDLMSARTELEQLAYVDQLTGLPNRTRFRELVAAAEVGTVLAVLDLDRFTEINDAFGHTCGDEVVVEVADLLADAPKGVVTARLGGDEFAVLVPPGVVDRHDVGERVTDALSRPVTLPSGLTLQTSASIGITVKSRDDTSADELLRQADVALNRAKRLHRKYEVYDARNDNSAPHRMMLLGEVRRALRGHEFELHYQPVIDCQSGRIVQLEALLHWRHPSLGLLAPVDLVEMIETSNLHGDIVRYQLEAVVAQVAAWRGAGLAVPVAINAGGATVHDERLVTAIAAIVEQSGLPSGAICLELAEHQLLLGTGISTQSLQRLDEAGLSITIDHFGTGSSPLAAIRHVPARSLKIDKTLVDDLRAGDGSFIGAIVTMAHDLGMLLGASGVDDQLSLQWLRTSGADRVQGAAIAAPVPADEVERLLRAHATMPVAR